MQGTPYQTGRKDDGPRAQHLSASPPQSVACGKPDMVPEAWHMARCLSDSSSRGWRCMGESRSFMVVDCCSMSVEPGIGGARGRWSQGSVEPEVGGARGRWSQGSVEPEVGGARGRWSQRSVEPGVGGARGRWSQRSVEPGVGGAR
eukprot:362743-Chlamydomonas_euryale.AAC.2